MASMHDKRFPGESDAYRKARNELLAAEADLRTRIEEVAALRRKLPPGGPLKEDYAFEEGAADLADTSPGRQVRFSELFGEGKPSLIAYSFMFGPDWENPCPLCTSLLDSLNGSAPHVQARANLVVIAKAPLARIRDWARGRGWSNLRLLSSLHNSYNTDYHAEDAQGGQWPLINVFRQDGADIHHFYNSELFFVPGPGGQDTRHVDMIWPLWNLLDLTPRDGARTGTRSFPTRSGPGGLREGPGTRLSRHPPWPVIS